MKSIWKHVILFVALILIIVGFHVFTINILDEHVTSLCKQGEEMIAMVQEERYDDALQAAEQMEVQWEKKGRQLCFFIDHEDVEEIGHMLAKVQSDFREETYALAVTEMQDIMAKAKDMYKRETLAPENIF